jgi:UDP-N-acetyl-D-galactosamine dehydrogenase
MGAHIAGSVVKLMMKRKIHVADSNVLILGLTFKENCPDIRNTRVIDIVEELKTYHANVDIYDPWANKDQVKDEYGYDLVDKPENEAYDAVILAVSHDEFKAMGTPAIKAFGKKDSVLYDVKSLLDKGLIDARL